MEKLKQRLEDLRLYFKQHRIYQSDIAKQCSMSVPYINAALGGRVVMSAKLARLLARFYNISEDWLLSGEGPMLLDKETESVLPGNRQTTLPSVETDSNHWTDIILKQQEMLALKERDICQKQEIIQKQQEMIQTLIKLLPANA